MEDNFQQSLDEYVMSKMIQSLAFRKEVSDILDSEVWQEDFKSPIFLNILKKIVINTRLLQIIEPIVKNNLLSVINHLKFKIDHGSATERKRYFEVCNELISMLNYSKEDNKYKFYKHELAKRYGVGSAIVQLYVPSYIEKYKWYLFDSIANDFGVIANQSDCIDDQYFKDEVLPVYVYNHFYLDSINAMLYEYPNIFSDFNFLNRTTYILEKNDELVAGDGWKEYSNVPTLDKNLVKRNKQVLQRINSFR